MSDVEKAAPVPPYVSFLSFWNALETVTESLPSQIDRSVLFKFSGTVQRLILHAFRYLNLTDEEGNPSETLRRLDGSSEEEKKKVLKELLEANYPDQMSIIADGTYKQFIQTFEGLPIEPASKRRCQTFFLKAANVAGLAVSPHITNVAKKRQRRTDSNNSKPKAKQPPKTPQKEKEEEEVYVPSDLNTTPIPIGPGRVWSVKTENKYTKADVTLFVQIAQSVLERGASDWDDD